MVLKYKSLSIQNSTNNIKNIVQKYKNEYVEHTDKQVWFEQIKQLGVEFGFANDMKLFKANPQDFKGAYGDVAGIIRVALTTKSNTPDLFEICNLLGKEQVVARLQKVLDLLA